MVLTLARRTSGAGAWPLVLLHGFTGSRDSFAGLEALLGDRVRLTALELPGHGGDAPPAGMTWQDTVASIAASLDQGPVHLAGYSLGARLALAVALQHPHLVLSLTLESGSAGLRTRGEQAARRSEDEELAQRIEREGVAAFVERWERHPVLEGLTRLPPHLQEELRAQRLGASPQGLAWALHALGQGAQPSLWDELPGLRVPTLLIHGALDARYSALARELAAQLPRSVRYEVPSAGHTPHLEQAPLFAAALLRHLEQSSPPTRSTP